MSLHNLLSKRSSKKLIYLATNIVKSLINGESSKYGNLWLNLHYVFLTMTKMRGKIPLEKRKCTAVKKDMFVQNSINEDTTTKTKSPKSATTIDNFFCPWQTRSKVSMALKSKKQ